MITNKTGVFINRNGGRSDVKVLSLHEKTNSYLGGGNPFSVTSIEVELEFDGTVDASGRNTWKGMGFPREGYIGFYTDGEICSRLVLNS